MSETNPLLAKIRIPGETFQLPSQGLFYTDGELDASVTNGEVEIFPMATIDEIILNTPDKLLSGKAITEVFSRCIPQILKPLNLLSKDVDFLLVCLRIVTFGPEVEIKRQHDCENAKDHTYQLNLQQIIKTTQKFDPTLIDREYKLVLPNGQQVQLLPTKYKDVLAVYEIAISKKMDEMSDKETESMLLNMLSNAIASVDGITDHKFILEWLTVLKLGFKKQIENTIISVSDWGINNEFNLSCKDCGELMKHQVSLNPVDFFFRQ